MIEQPDFIYDENNTKVDLFQHQLISVYEMEKLERDRKVRKTMRLQDRMIYADSNGEYLTRSEFAASTDPNKRSVIIYKDRIRETHTNVGFFRDIPGYGKTLSMCALIARDFRFNTIEWDLSTPYIREYNERVSANTHNIIKDKYTKCDSVVIICPSNLIHQWKKELNRCKLVCYEATCNKSIDEIKNIEFLNENYHVVLVNCNFLYAFLNKFKYYAFRRCIYDEIVDSRTPHIGNNELIANFYWFISATIYSTIRRFRNSWFCNLLPSTMDDYDIISIRNSPDFIKNSITLPKPQFTTHFYSANAAYSKLKGFVDKRIEELLKNGNIDEALTLLNVDDTDNIFDAVVKNIDNKITRIRTMSPGPLRTTRLNDALTEKENILKRINTYTEDDNDCSICMTSPKEDYIITTCCYNIFCTQCLLMALTHKQTCPLCRGKVNTENLIRHTNNMCERATNNIKSDKIMNQQETLLKVINQIRSNGPERKILLFSEYDSVYQHISSRIENAVIESLKGNQTHRENVINSFRAGNIDILYLNSVNNAAGINLTEATDIILYHEMCTSRKDQIIGRAIRIGCNHSVYVHELKSIS